MTHESFLHSITITTKSIYVKENDQLFGEHSFKVKKDVACKNGNNLLSKLKKQVKYHAGIHDSEIVE